MALIKVGNTGTGGTKLGQKGSGVSVKKSGATRKSPRPCCGRK